jgi:cyclase
MLRNRVIPCLLLDEGRLVKTTKFKKPKYVGDPINAVKIFNEKEVDEIILIDINASKKQYGPNFKLIEEIASECFIPLCYGGGIKTVDDAKRLFNIGVEKVSIQSACFEDLNLISEISRRFGSQSVVASIDLGKTFFGKTYPFFSKNNRFKKVKLQELLSEYVKAGAGEVLLNTIYNDGVMKGMDLSLIKETSSSCSVPVIYMGGVGSLEDIKLAVDEGAKAVGVGSFFVFHGPHKGVLITYPSQDVLNDLIG